jgi:DNA-binding beta-propeller fold protein YncE
MTLELLNKEFEFVGAFSFQSHTEAVNVEFDVSSQTSGNLTSLTFSPSGDRMFVLEASTPEIFQFGLSTAFDIETASFTTSFQPPTASEARGVSFSESGGRLYLTKRTDASSNTSQDFSVEQFELGTAFDLSGTVSFQTKLSTSSLQGPGGRDFDDPHAAQVRSDGAKAIVLGRTFGGNQDLAVELDLGTDFNISTATQVDASRIGTSSSNAGLAVSPDETRIFPIFKAENGPAQIDLGAPFSLAEFSPDETATLDVSDSTSDATGIAFNSDGTAVFIIDNNTNAVLKFILGRAVPTEP